MLFMTIEHFDAIYQRAAERKGGKQHLELLLSKPRPSSELQRITDDRWLAAFTMKVFQCGISWQVVRNKWPNFEQLFFNFKLEPLMMLPEEIWEQKAQDVQMYHVDTFVIGDDWQGKFDFLKDYCQVNYLPRTAEVSTTQIKNDMKV